MHRRLHVRATAQLALLVLLAIWIYPIGVALYKSVSSGGWANYTAVLNHPTFDYWQAITNSFIFAGVTAVVIMLMSSLAGYAFSKMRFKGRNVLYRLLVACLAVPIAAVVTPLFFTINTMGLRNTYLGVLIPLISFNALMMLLIMRNHFDGLPDELIEAAMLDGYGPLQIWWKVLMPLSGPALATVGVLSFVYSWNEYLLPVLLLSKEGLFPVTQAISLLQSARMSQVEISQLYAGLILMTIPSIIVYLVSQRYLQAGITAGAVKS